MKNFKIRTYEPDDENSVIDLWQKCNLTVPHNNPRRDIERKLEVDPELFLVGLVNDAIIATCMAGYEGHRGWINYLAVSPGFRRQGIAGSLMKEAENKLLSRGCPKINLQVRESNEEIFQFYQRIGYLKDHVVSFGKRLIPD